MTATFANAPTSNRVTATPLLRAVLLVDGIGCVAFGVLLFPFAGVLEGMLGLPAALFLAVAVYLLGYGAAETFVGTRTAPARAAVVALIALNAMWVLDSAIVLATGWFEPTTTGVVTIAVLAAGVAGVTALQAFAYRRA